MGVGVVPDFYVDITSWQAEKRAAILAHTSQMPERFASGAALLNRFRAAQCNAPEGHYAEAYRSAAISFADIRAMIPPPPPYRPYYVQVAEGFL